MTGAVLTDIEGTTSSLSFVKDVLFPYARAHIGDFVRRRADDPAVMSHVDEIRRLKGDPEAGIDDVVAQLVEWIDEDRKVTALKALQGLVWEHGYRSGDFLGHVYEDVPPALRAWRDRGLRLYIYSSGSVYAQKLLFGHTQLGDLASLFDGFFDTRIGQKTDIASYGRIAGEMNLPADEVLFLSDIESELDAARAAGMRTTWLVRDAVPDPRATHAQVRDFTGIDP